MRYVADFAVHAPRVKKQLNIVEVSRDGRNKKYTNKRGGGGQDAF